jgi:hypothetical protein
MKKHPIPTTSPPIIIAALLISGCALRPVSPSEFKQEIESLNLPGLPFETAITSLQQKGYECRWDNRPESSYYMKVASCDKRGTFELVCPQRLSVHMTLKPNTHAIEKVDTRLVEKACF